ncbi:MAG: hypothetical protein IKL57_01015 [Oscillospiraceae bacterium]|nr:hypothetical protein [Oscillospiraceae bacterium]
MNKQGVRILPGSPKNGLVRVQLLKKYSPGRLTGPSGKIRISAFAGQLANTATNASRSGISNKKDVLRTAILQTVRQKQKIFPSRGTDNVLLDSFRAEHRTAAVKKRQCRNIMKGISKDKNRF